jgi:hypothetical protein
MDLPINPTFAAKTDIEFVEPVANYFPLSQTLQLASLATRILAPIYSTNLKRVKSSIEHVIFTNNIRPIDQGQSEGGSRLCHRNSILICTSRHAPNS